MRPGCRWIGGLLLALWLSTLAYAQPARPIGVVTAIHPADKRIVIRTDAGPEMTILLADATTFLRVAPGEKDLKNAAAISLSEIRAGDRVLARGSVAADGKSVEAVSLIVMNKDDIAGKHAAERAEWEKRGVGGIITAMNPGAKEITISVPSLTGAGTLVIALAKDALLRRYAPDSVKFSDARPSRFDELEVGDQVRALGSRSEDGTRFTAEELVSGSFRNMAATVVTVDTGQNTIQVTDLLTNKPLVVRVNADSNLRKLPPFVAQMLAMRGAAPGPGGLSGAGGPPTGMMQRPRDLQSMLEKMPPITLADLKPGDAIAVASTAGADPSQITAITILAGVEPLLTAAPEGGRQMMTGAWNLDLNMNMNMGLP